jgi:hypothetical protein
MTCLPLKSKGCLFLHPGKPRRLIVWMKRPLALSMYVKLIALVFF